MMLLNSSFIINNSHHRPHHQAREQTSLETKRLNLSCFLSNNQNRVFNVCQLYIIFDDFLLYPTSGTFLETETLINNI